MPTFGNRSNPFLFAYPQSIAIRTTALKKKRARIFVKAAHFTIEQHRHRCGNFYPCDKTQRT